MPEMSLHVCLEEREYHSGQFILSFGSSQYPVTIRHESDVILMDWLHRLYPVLVGLEDPAGKVAPQQLLRNVGTWLWHALLPDSAPSQEREALAQALRTGRSPLLLALPDTLAGLPWELLYNSQFSDERGFLARRRPLIRLSTPQAAVMPIELPLRVLLLISSPPVLGEDSRVDVESERAAVEQATREMREAGFLHLLVEDIVTPERVQQALIRFKPHIVHYIGHGEFDNVSGGILYWEDEQGNILRLSDVRLAEILRPRNIHAVVLHACETGRSNTRTNVCSVVETLVHEGIPIVLAQQANFTYESSQRASNAWYTALTAGQSFAEALFEMRQALAMADRPDWAVPTLCGSPAALIPILDTTAFPGPVDPLLTTLGITADLPTPTGIFVGRHYELRRLRLMLEKPGSGQVMALIIGQGGIGKSTLASQAIARYSREYTAVLTLSCKGYQNIEIFLKGIGEFLKGQGVSEFLESILPVPQLDTKAKIERAITALNSVGPLLLVIDSLEETQNRDQMVRDELLLYFLRKLLTNLRGGRVIITSRYTMNDLLPHKKFEAYLLELPLDELSYRETWQLLTQHPSLARSTNIHKILIQKFGGLPYVYDLLGGTAKYQSLEMLIHDSQGRITQERKQRGDTEWQTVRNQIIRATLDTAISQLPEPARTLLKRLGVLHRPFPLDAIEKGLQATNAEWRLLLDRSLLYYNALEHTYRLHSITRQYVEGQLDEQNRRQAQADLAAWYQGYARHETYRLEDSLEAYRLWQACGDVCQAGALAMELAPTLSGSGLHSLLHDLCERTLRDIGKRDEPLVADALYHLGMIGLEQGDYEKARGFSQQSLEIADQLGDQDRQARVLHQLGVIAQEQGDYQEAQQSLQQSRIIFSQRSNESAQAGVLHQLGIIAREQGDYQEAQQLLQQSLEIEKRWGNHNGQANSLHALGILAQEQRDYQKAQQLYEKSWAIFKQLGNRFYQATIVCALGSLHLEQGNYPEAVQLTLDSLEIADRLGDQRGRAGASHQLGVIAQEQGDYQEAQQRLQKSLDIKERLGDLLGQADSLYQLGIIAQKQGNYNAAQGFYQKSLKITEQIGNRRGQAHALYQLGIIARKSGSYKQALAYMERAKTLFDFFFSPYRETTQREIEEIKMDRICKEVVTLMRAGNAEQQKTLATRLEQMPKEDLIVEGAQDFLEMLVAWLRGHDIQALIEKLQPAFHKTYMQMVATVKGEVPLTPALVASFILQATKEDCLQFAAQLIKRQQALPPEKASLGRFLGCLAAALRGEIPEIASLEAPFTNLWQEFQNALSVSQDESSQQDEEKDG